MFLTINRKYIVIVLIFIILASILFSLPAIKTSSPKYKYTVVIDAGHGGIDGGSVGTTGVTENELNLTYANSLKPLFESAGINVVMTRTNKNGLYNVFSTNKKKDDMQKRKEIILDSNADLVVSIHMNSFPLKSCRGAQAFYKEGDETSMLLAKNIQSSLIANIDKARKNVDKGDYFILNCSTIPSVIVECGFISNPEEEALILSDNYREKLCYSIFCGILAFLGS